MANFGMHRYKNDRAPMQKSHPTKGDDYMSGYNQGYKLGLQAGIEQERAAWMKKIGDAVIDAMREATAPGDW